MYTFPFKISYNNAVTHILLRTLSDAPEALVNLAADYAAYHPEYENYARGSDPENYEPAPAVLAKKKTVKHNKLEKKHALSSKKQCSFFKCC